MSIVNTFQMWDFDVEDDAAMLDDVQRFSDFQIIFEVSPLHCQLPVHDYNNRLRVVALSLSLSCMTQKKNLRG